MEQLIKSIKANMWLQIIKKCAILVALTAFAAIAGGLKGIFALGAAATIKCLWDIVEDFRNILDVERKLSMMNVRVIEKEDK